MGFGAGIGVGIACGFGAGIGSGVAVGIASAKSRIKKQLDAAIRDKAISIRSSDGQELSTEGLLELLERAYKKA